MKKTFVIARRRKKSTSFNPSKEYVNKAIEDYLKKGGKITKIVDLSDNLNEFISAPDVKSPADEFLMDRF
ncbi:MAG: hypothetical protein OEY59_00675 [Deltaproteobacteria bacterium]|nr:hypothetical protein [Deltaproteobacteria bacterium]